MAQEKGYILICKAKIAWYSKISWTVNNRTSVLPSVKCISILMLSLELHVLILIVQVLFREYFSSEQYPLLKNFEIEATAYSNSYPIYIKHRISLSLHWKGTTPVKLA